MVREIVGEWITPELESAAEMVREQKEIDEWVSEWWRRMVLGSIPKSMSYSNGMIFRESASVYLEFGNGSAWNDQRPTNNGHPQRFGFNTNSTN